MRIADVRCARLTYRYSPDETWSWPGGTYHGWTACFAQVEAEDGTVGVGEIGDGLPAPDLVPAVVEHVAAVLDGADATRPRELVRRMRMTAPTWGRRGLAVSVISGIEAALYDLLGRSLDVPVHVLLGGASRDRVPVYASGGLDPDASAMAKELQRYVDRGFSAVKVRIGYGQGPDVDITRAARDAVGPSIKLLLDAGASYVSEPPRLVDVVRLARELEPFDPYWLEEPLEPDDIAGHRRLRASTSIPIAAGENARTRHEALALVDGGAVDIIQTDAVYAGGLAEQLEIGMLADARGVVLAPHTWGSAPGLMANLHAAFCLRNTLIVEYSQAPNPLRDLLLVEPLDVDEGHLRLPRSSGLGVELTDELIERYPYDPGGGVEHAVADPPATAPRGG